MKNINKIMGGVAALAILASAAPASAHGLDLKLGSDSKINSSLGAKLFSNLGLHAGSLNQVVATNSEGKAVVVGSVTAESASSLSIASSQGTWTVNTANAKMANREKVVADVNVGDRVIVVGQLSGTNALNASVIKDLSINNGKDHDDDDAKENKAGKKSVAVGTASNVNAAAKTFTLTDKNGATTTVSIGADTKVRIVGEGVTSSASSTVNASSTVTVWNLLNNAKVQVRGILDKATNTISALKVYAVAKISM